jgi:DNA-binding transcriptional LysR family regulator
VKPRSSVILNRLLTRFRIRHIQVLVTLAEMGNVRRTAVAIGMTQPAVTLLLAEMERLIETPLFLRHSRGVTPTAMALDLLPLARHMLADLQSGAEMVAARLSHGEGVVRVGASAAGVSAILAKVLPGFSRDHPDIQVQVEELDTPEIAARIAGGTTDIIFCRQPALLPQGWHFRACAADRFVVVCGNQHPLRRKRVVRLQDLQDVTWLPNSLASAAHKRHEALMAQLGWNARDCGILTRTASLTWTLLDSAPLVTLVPLGVVSPWVERGLLHVLPLDLDMPFEPTGMLLPAGAQNAACATMERYVLGLMQPQAHTGPVT